MGPLLGIAILALLPQAGTPGADLAAARQEMAAGRPRDAARALEAALESGAEPGGARARLLADAWFAAGEARRAEAALRDGLEATPRDTRLHLSLARSLDRRGRQRDAVALLHGALLLDAGATDVWLELATLADRTGPSVEGLLLQMRFLTLEATGERATAAARRVMDLAGAAARLELGLGSSREEATRQAYAAAAVRLGALLGPAAPAPRPAAVAAALEALCLVLAAQPRPDDLFEGGALTGYFAAAARHGHAGALGREVLAVLADPEIEVWRAAHADQVRGWHTWAGRLGTSLPN